jgi:putative MATE family efflux protein
MNIILDPLLIFGLLGFPRLEVQGAAWATVISYMMAVAVGLYVLYVRKKLITIDYVRNLKEFGNSAKRLLFIALPAGLTNTIQPFVNAVIVALLSSGGAEAVAAYGIVSRIEAFAFIVVMGVAVGMGPIIGQNWGAGRYERVNETLRLAIRFAMIYSLAVALVLITFAKPIAGLFSQDSEVVRIAALFFWIVPLTYAFANLVNGWASAFNAMGKPQRSFTMIVVKMLFLMLPAVYVGHLFYGVTGLFAAIALVNLTAGVAIHIFSWRSCRAKEHQSL